MDPAVRCGWLALMVMAVSPSSARATVTGQGPPLQPLSHSDLEAWLDGFLPYALARDDIAGGVVVVVRDGRVLFQKGYGYADSSRRVLVDAERTVFRVGSIAKLFTWTAVLQLVERGKLDLDRDLNAYLDFPLPTHDTGPITLRHLMTHTPGFEEVLKNLMTADPAALPSLRSYVMHRTPRRIFPPGTVPAYSNYGAALAGYVIERVSGEPFDDYIERHMLRPLGMTMTTSRQPLPERLVPGMSSGYRLGSGPEQPYELIGPAPAGGLATTGSDMARFMIAHLRDGMGDSARLLSPETARLMHGTPLHIIPPLNSMMLGFYERSLNGRRIIGHDGDTQFFHSGLSLFPDEGVGVFISLNSTGRDNAAVVLREAVIEQFTDRYFPDQRNARYVEAAVAAEHAQMLAGTYQASRRSQTSFVSLVHLFAQVKVVATDGGTIQVPAVVGANGRPKQWREVEPFVWHEVGGHGRLAARVENGRVAMWSVDAVSPWLVFQPAPWWGSSAWLVPLFVASLATFLATGLAWPVGAVARRRLKASSTLSADEARAVRLVQGAAIGVLVIVTAWVATILPVATNLFFYSSRLDPWIVGLRLLSLALFGVGSGAAIWHAWVVWRGSRGPFSKLWSLLLVVAFFTMLWIGAVFRLIGFGSDY